MADDVINQLLLSRAIPGVSFNFIAYVEPEIPDCRHIIKLKILEGLRYTRNPTPRPVTHSFTHSHSH